MVGTVHQRNILGPEWIFVGMENGLEVYIHQEKDWVNLFNPKTGEIIED